jgi:hypothetical protein
MTPPDRQQKRQTLRRHGTLNPQPESVTHPLFQNSDFFDPDFATLNWPTSIL